MDGSTRGAYMTKIIDAVDYWIEMFTVPRASVPGTTRVDTNFTLEKAGRYLVALTTVDADLIPGNINDVFAIATNTDDSEMIYGQALSVIRVSVFNSAGVARTMGAKVIVYLR